MLYGHYDGIYRDSTLFSIEITITKIDGISDGASQTHTYVLQASPKQTLIAYMRYLVASYPKVVNFVLDKYSINETIIQTQDAIKKLHQLPNKRTSDSADYFRSRTNRFGSAYGLINHI